MSASSSKPRGPRLRSNRKYRGLLTRRRAAGARM